jgi:hypothetical protein
MCDLADGKQPPRQQVIQKGQSVSCLMALTPAPLVTYSSRKQQLCGLDVGPDEI